MGLVDREAIIAAIKEDRAALAQVENQTPGLCLAVVTKWSEALQYVREQTLGLCLVAAVQDRGSVGYIRDEAMKEKVKWFLNLPDDLFPAAGRQSKEELVAFGKRLMELFDVPKTNPSSGDIEDTAYKLLTTNGFDVAKLREEEQTPERCLMAVVKELDAFEFVKERTPELCRAAVVCYEANLERVEQTPELCFLAVWYSATAVRYIKNPVILRQAVAIAQHRKPAMAPYFKAVLSVMSKLYGSSLDWSLVAEERKTLGDVVQYPTLLQGIVGKSPEFYVAAVMANPMCLRYVRERTPEVCMVAVLRHGMALRFVDEQTEDMCTMAVGDLSRNLEWAEKQTPEACMMAVERNGMML